MSVTLDALAAETGWLRRLARSLVHDAAAAEDLVHDAYVIAAERPPEDAPLKPWLVRVMTNLTRMRFRGEARRDSRERAVAELASAPATPDELVERLELHRMLASLVLELPPLSRDIVLLTFFEGMSSSAAGKRLGVPASTVRRRLQQALAELRAKLDDRKPRKAWLAALAGFGWPKRAAAAALPWLVAAGIAILLAAGWAAVQLHREPEALVTRPDRAHRAHDASRALPHDDKYAVVPPAQRARLVELSPVLFHERGVTARVVDDAGSPVADAEVTLACSLDPSDPFSGPPPRTTRSGPDGSFVFDGPIAQMCAIVARKGELAGGGYPAMAREDGRLDIAIRPTIEAAIHVVDAATGAPIAGAEVSATAMLTEAGTTTTDARGDAHLRVHDAPALMRDVAQTKVSVRHPDYVGADVQLTSAEVQRRTSPNTVKLVTGPRVRGQVRDREERPVANAIVHIVGPFPTRTAFPDLPTQVVHTDAEGRFDVHIAAGDLVQMVATTASAITTSIDEIAMAIPPGGRDDVLLHVVPRDRVGIEGVVVDERDAPVPNATIVPWNFTQLPSITSDAQGRFALRLVRERMHLVARAGELASELVAAEAVRGKLNRITLRVARAGITGVVVDAEGHSIAGAQVWLNDVKQGRQTLILGQRFFTDSNGAFSINVPRGRFKLSVRRSFDDDFLDEDDVWVEGGSRDVKLVLP